MSDEAVLESDASPELQAEFAAFQKEEAPPEEVETTLETPSEEPEVPEAEPSEPEDPYSFTIKGEEKAYTKDQLKHVLSREETFQQKANNLEKSDEYKMGILFREAKGGDATAQKALKHLLGEMADLDTLDEVEGDFDVDKKHEDVLEQSKTDEHFVDVKDDVDYQDTMDKIQTDLKAKMPAKVFESYWENASTRRVMYDLEKSGRAEELLSAFDDELNKLSTYERANVKSSPDLYGNLFVEVLNSQNAAQKTPSEKPAEKSAMSAVSSGNGSRSVVEDDSNPDWENMSSEEFRKAEARLLNQNRG